MGSWMRLDAHLILGFTDYMKIQHDRYNKNISIYNIDDCKSCHSIIEKKIRKLYSKQLGFTSDVFKMNLDTEGTFHMNVISRHSDDPKATYQTLYRYDDCNLFIHIRDRSAQVYDGVKFINTLNEYLKKRGVSVFCVSANVVDCYSPYEFSCSRDHSWEMAYIQDEIKNAQSIKKWIDDPYEYYHSKELIDICKLHYV